VKDVRLVTYRSGASKGIAYIEYESEVIAIQAWGVGVGVKIKTHSPP
jgi:hypothetical protein